jgi:hypothetical protein
VIHSGLRSEKNEKNWGHFEKWMPTQCFYLFIYFQFFLCCSKTGHHQPQKDLAKFGYKNLEPYYLLGNYGDFKRSWNSSIYFRNLKKKKTNKIRKLEICPNSAK